MTQEVRGLGGSQAGTAVLSGELKRMIALNVAAMAGATMFVFLNAYFIAHGMEKREVGFGDAGFWVISVVLQPWLGPNLDRRGRVLFLRLGAALLALAAFGYALVPPEIGAVLPLRVLHGAGFALYLTAAWAWVSDHAPAEHYETVFGLFGLSSLGGSIVGPVAAQLLRGSQAPYDDRGVFVVAGALLAIVLLGLFTVHEATTRGPGHHGHGGESGRGEPGGLWALARRPRLRGPVLGSLSFGLAVGSLFAFAAAYLEALHVENVAHLFVVLTLVAGVGRAFCGKLSRRFGAANLMAPCLVALALGSGGLGILQFFSHPPVGLILAVGAVAGIGYGLVYPILNALAYERLHASERGRGMSLVAAGIDSGNSVGAVAAGFLAQRHGEGDMFLLMGAAVAVSGMLARILDRSK